MFLDPNFNDPALQQQAPVAELPPPSSDELRAMADEQDAMVAQQEAEKQAQVMSQLQSPELEAGPPPVPKTKGTLDELHLVGLIHHTLDICS